MPIQRESDTLGSSQSDAPAEPHAPREPEVIHELQEHEFTLEVELEVDSDGDLAAADEAAQGWSDEHTARWSTHKPVPAWATTARALLEGTPASTAIDADTTRKTPLVSCSILELRALRDETTFARAEAQKRAEALEVSERALAAAVAELSARDRQLAQHTAEQLGRDRGRVFRIAELEGQLHEIAAALRELQQTLKLRAAAAYGEPGRVFMRTPNAARGRKRDDLRQIQGIGPRFVERLDALGISTYARIAAWTPAEVARIGAELGVGAKRIRREAWVKQARKLAGSTARPG